MSKVVNDTFLSRANSALPTLFFTILIAGWARSVLPALHSGFALSEFLMGPLFLLTAIGFIPFFFLFLVCAFRGINLGTYKVLSYAMGFVEVGGGLYDFIDRAPQGELPLLDAWSYLPFLQILIVIPIGVLISRLTTRRRPRPRRRLLGPSSAVSGRVA